MEIMNCSVLEEKKDNKLKKYIFKRISILRWLPKYNKMDFISDLIAGITLGMTMMPQAIAYASLADVPAEYGLYTAFMGSIVYVFFGTIKEVSIGPTSLLSLLIFSYTDGLSLDHVILLCFTSGFVVFMMGVFKLGFLVDFISAPVTSAFTSATSIIILSSQVKGLLGFNVEGKGIIELYKNIFKKIDQINMADFGLGISAMVVLLVIRQIGRLDVKNKRVKKILFLFSNSRNGMVVMISSWIAFAFCLKNGEAPFKLTGSIPAGLPPFKFPNLTTVQNNETIPVYEMVANLGSGVIVIPIVAVLQNIAIAKAFSTGAVDATQEMMTLGLANMLGSFVQAIPASGAFTRSAVSNASGVRTPLAGLYAATIILLALGFLTPYFYYIPKATLSAVLIVAVVFMVDYEIVPKLWKNHKFDLAVNIITFVLCLSCGVEIGLFVGILISTASLLQPWTRPEIETKIYLNNNNQEFLLVKPEMGLYFPAVDYINEQIKKASLKTDGGIIVDFCNFRNVDYSACQGLKTLITNLKKQNRQIIFYNTNNTVYNKIRPFAATEKSLIVCSNLSDLNIMEIDHDAQDKTAL